MGHDVMIYRDIPCDITNTRSPRNTRQKILTQIQRKRTTSLRSTLVFFRMLSLPSSWVCSSGLFCRSSAIHQLETSYEVGLTIPPANSNLVPSGLGLLLSACMLVFFSFFFFPPHYGSLQVTIKTTVCAFHLYRKISAISSLDHLLRRTVGSE